MATLTVYPTAGEGFTLKTGAVQADTRTGNASSVSKTDTVFSINYLNDGGTYYCYRAFLPFDTSALAGGTVTAAVFSVKPSVVTVEHAISLVGSTQASSTDLVVGDHALFGTTKLATDISDFTVDTYSDYTLNASGLAAISTTGYTKLALITTADVAAGAVDGTNMTFNSFDAVSESNRPKLVITYTPASGSGFMALL